MTTSTGLQHLREITGRGSGQKKNTTRSEPVNAPEEDADIPDHYEDDEDDNISYSPLPTHHYEDGLSDADDGADGMARTDLTQADRRDSPESPSPARMRHTPPGEPHPTHTAPASHSSSTSTSRRHLTYDEADHASDAVQLDPRLRRKPTANASTAPRNSNATAPLLTYTELDEQRTIGGQWEPKRSEPECKRHYKPLTEEEERQARRNYRIYQQKGEYWRYANRSDIYDFLISMTNPRCQRYIYKHDREYTVPKALYLIRDYVSENGRGSHWTDDSQLTNAQDLALRRGMFDNLMEDFLRVLHATPDEREDYYRRVSREDEKDSSHSGDSGRYDDTSLDGSSNASPPRSASHRQLLNENSELRVQLDRLQETLDQHIKDTRLDRENRSLLMKRRMECLQERHKRALVPDKDTRILLQRVYKCEKRGRQRDRELMALRQVKPYSPDKHSKRTNHTNWRHHARRDDSATAFRARRARSESRQ